MSFDLKEYVDVAERIQQFYAKYPDGRLTAGSPPEVVDVGGKPFVWYHARAYRSPDDQLPADGYAAEPVPGPTQFTRDSELMNAETAAWGRAIVALGFATKHMASANEVKARTDPPASPPPVVNMGPDDDIPFEAGVYKAPAGTRGGGNRLYARYMGLKDKDARFTLDYIKSQMQASHGTKDDRKLSGDALAAWEKQLDEWEGQ